jgi:molybdopterin converting factor small subunit
MTTTEPAGTVTVRYFAAAKAAAARTEEQRPVPEPPMLGALLSQLRAAHGSELSRVLDRCSFLVDEVSAHDGDAPLHAGAVVDVLPPFAGG